MKCEEGAAVKASEVNGVHRVHRPDGNEGQKAVFESSCFGERGSITNQLSVGTFSREALAPTPLDCY